MAFCNNCGKFIPENSKFCQECGARVFNDLNTLSLRFYCPNCDRQINLYNSVCSNCGFKFDGIKVTESLKEFINKVDAETTASRKAFVIRHSAFPSKTEDIKTFMFIASSSIIHAKVQDEFYDSWMAKLEQCKNKASKSVSDSAQMDVIMGMYWAALNKSPKPPRVTTVNEDSNPASNNVNNSNTKDSHSSSTNQNTKRIVYNGDLFVCPNCGDTVKAFMSSCPSCGYEFRGAKTATSAIIFNKKLMQAKTNAKKAALIRNFVIPNTTEDIKEFTILASTNIKEATYCDEIYYAWLTKLEQCKTKAEMSIRDSIDRQAVLDLYHQTISIVQRRSGYTNHTETQSQSQQNYEPPAYTAEEALISNGGILGGLLLIIISIIVNRLGGDAVLFEFAAILMMMFSSFTLKKRDAHIIDYFITVIGAGLAFLLSKFLASSAIIILGVVLTLVLTVKNCIFHITHKDFI